MKAPDKIYISHLCDTTIDGEEGHLMAMSFEDNGGKEYIRKDALIELIKEESKFWDDGEMIFRGLIDKLNSM